MDHVLRKVGQSLLVRNLGNLCSQSSEIRLLFDEECCTSYFCGRTGSLHPCCSSAYDNYVTRFRNMALFVFFSVGYSRINGAADRTVNADTVAGASDIAGDTFPDIADIAEFYFVDPFRISDQTSADTDQIRVSSCQDILRHMWIPDITHCYTGLVIAVFDCSGHIGTPSVREMVRVNLVLNGTVQAA